MTTKLNNNILITACSIDPVGFNVIESLRPNFKKIIGVDTNYKPIIDNFVDKFYLVPPAKNPNYISTILYIAKKNKIRAIFPITVEESLVLKKNIKILHKNKIILINENNFKILKICNDKYKSIKFLQKKGLKEVPISYEVKNVNDLKNVAKLLKYPSKPFIIKPRITHGSRGFKIIKEKYPRFKNNLMEKPTENIYLTLNELKNIIGKAKNTKFVAMELLKGPDYSVYGYAKNGEAIYTIPMKRLVLLPGMTLYGLLENNKNIIKYVNQIISKLKYTGIFNVQLILTKKGPIFYEINPRIAATTIITKKAGINLALLATLDSLGYEKHANALIKKSHIKWDTGLYRIHKEVVFEYEKG